MEQEGPESEGVARRLEAGRCTFFKETDEVLSGIMPAMPSGLPIHHVALRVADPERAAAFYSGVLGLPELRRTQDDGQVRAIWLRAAGAVIMLERALKGSGPSEGTGHVLALAVDDLASWERRLASVGIAVDDRTASTLYVHDPDGHRVALSVYDLGIAD